MYKKMETLKIFEAISLSIAVASLGILIVQMREVYKGNSEVNSLFFPVVTLLLASMGYFAFKLQQEKDSFSKSYYELKLNNGDIIRDSLQEGWDYFYNDKGERYYKSNIIYSKKLNK
jgi:hypothetical protein